MLYKAKDGGNANETSMSQAEIKQKGFLFVYPERACSVPVIPAKTSTFQYSEEKCQLSWLDLVKLYLRDIIGSEVLEIKYII